ncbi:hypothetical protein, partial [Roseibacillus persicicus]|uniref:hypothetical protein n=1 Tax=Roseibacillus persicicus TaxID=454148 RepID=UPI001E4485B7
MPQFSFFEYVNNIIFILFIPIIFLIFSCANTAQSLRDSPLTSPLIAVSDAVTGNEEGQASKSIYAPKSYRYENYRDPSGRLVSYQVAFERYNSPGIDPGLKANFIYQCVNAIDENYLAYLNRIATGRATLDTTLDITSIGLSTAATIYTPTTTKTILSGLDTFLKGGKSSYQQNFFAALTIFQQL